MCQESLVPPGIEVAPASLPTPTFLLAEEGSGSVVSCPQWGKLWSPPFRANPSTEPTAGVVGKRAVMRRAVIGPWGNG